MAAQFNSFRDLACLNGCPAAAMDPGCLLVSVHDGSASVSKIVRAGLVTPGWVDTDSVVGTSLAPDEACPALIRAVLAGAWDEEAGGYDVVGMGKVLVQVVLSDAGADANVVPWEGTTEHPVRAGFAGFASVGKGGPEKATTVTLDDLAANTKKWQLALTRL